MLWEKILSQRYDYTLLLGVYRYANTHASRPLLSFSRSDYYSGLFDRMFEDVLLNIFTLFFPKKSSFIDLSIHTHMNLENLSRSRVRKCYS